MTLSLFLYNYDAIYKFFCGTLSVVRANSVSVLSQPWRMDASAALLLLVLSAAPPLAVASHGESMPSADLHSAVYMIVL